MMRIVTIILLLFTSSAAATAAPHLDKTPQDTYRLTVTLADAVRALRQQQGVKLAWPAVVVQGSKGARHEYQKALEVLSKINRYRIIHKLGPVATPYYPSREITPNEVYDLIQRLINEVKALHVVITPTPRRSLSIPATRADNYRLLWEISRAFDPLLGVRGFLPGDVFAQSQRVVELIRFLRTSQNSPSMPPKPARPHGKHPNHALAAAYHLLAKVRQAERNLWMDPVEVPQMEKRVITPTEVYDALQTNIAELQRIKFRLGVDRAFDDSQPVANKTPDDVIQNLVWAANAMPSFTLGQPLTQYDPQSLEKSPSDVFAIASLTLRKLRHYKRLRGIHTRASQPPAVTGLRPRHVYQKTLECLKKVGELRRQAGFAASATPYFPMRVITPNDVFALASQLDRALGLIYATIDMPQDMLTAQDAGSKTSSEVFRVMWQISYELDAILGSQGQTPNDVYRMASYAVAHIQRLQHKLGYQSHAEQPARIPDLKPADVIEQARTLLVTISQLKKRAGIFGSGLPVARHDAIVTPNDVFNLVSVIIAELIDVEIHLGISNQLALPAVTHDKTPSDVYQQLQFAERLLHDMLGGTIE